MVRTLQLAAILSLLLALLTGCGGGAYSSLVSEDDVTALAALKARSRALKHHTVLVPTGEGPAEVRVAVHEYVHEEHSRTIVLIHGVLSDHNAWRFIAGDLAQDYNLMLVDLPGAGDSDKPEPEILGPGGYAPQAQAARVLEVIEHRLLELPLGDRTRITVMGHSLGGAIVLRMFCDAELSGRFEPVLSRIDSVVLLSPLDVNVPRPDPAFRQIAEVSPTELAIGDALGLLKQKIAEATRQSVVDGSRALREEADTRLRYFRDPARRRAAQAMLRQAIPWKDERPDWDAIEPVESEYCRVELPALILWGRRDETLPVSMGYKLAAELPKARLVCLPRVMHSPHIEAPEKTAELIRAFLQEQSAAAR